MSASVQATVNTASDSNAVDATANLEAQQDEMTALSSILDPATFVLHEPSVVGAPLSGCMIMNVSVPDEGVQITSSLKTKAPDDASGAAVAPVGSFVVKYLPPLTLHFTLPAGYPTQERPTFTLSACWLDRKRLSTLCRKLDLLWEENKELGAILFVWYTYLKEDIFEELGLVPDYDISWWYQGPQHGHLPGRDRHRSGASFTKEKVAIVEDSEQPKTETIPKKHKPKQQHQEPHQPKEKEKLDPRAVVDWLPIASLATHLAAYNDESIEAEFTLTSHSCEICFSEVAGTDCVKFPGCGHIYCRPCVRSYYVGLITDGAVEGVRCPGFQCKSVPTPNQVRSVVGEELYERYDRLLLQRTLDSMEDVLYCPRAACHAHVLYDPSEKIATCSACRYVFCSVCKMVYHGVEPCRFKTEEKVRLFDQYSASSGTERTELERKYGKKQLAILVQTVQSERWVTQKSKPCPHCQVPIEKFEGCNKVTCFKCQTYFCWNCSAQLDTKNPYFHFNDPNSACYNTLFEGVVLFGHGDDDDDDDDEDWSDSDDDWLDEEDILADEEG